MRNGAGVGGNPVGSVGGSAASSSGRPMGGAPRLPRAGPVQQIAFSLASKSYAKMHDVGKAADPSQDPSRSMRSRRSRTSAPATPANSMHSRLDRSVSVSRSTRWRLGNGMHKAGTSVLLSEMGMQDPSTRGEGLRYGHWLWRSLSRHRLGAGSKDVLCLP